MNRGCVCPTCLHGGGIVDWIKKNKLPILGALGTIGALGTSALGYKLGQQVIRDTNRAIPSLPYGLSESNYDYLHGSGYGSDFIDWVKKNKKPLLATLGTIGALGATSAGLSHLGSKTMNLNPDIRGSGLFGDVISGALTGALSGVPRMISENKEDFRKLFKNR